MFDPTIYENMKVVLEGVIYDLDLEGQIEVINRKDLINLALMTREYHCEFIRKDTSNQLSATVILKAQTEDLAAEILEQPNKTIGCQMFIKFKLPLKNEIDDPEKIQRVLEEVWESRPTITQAISYERHHAQKQNLKSNISLHFNRKINEDNLDDFPSLVDVTIKTLERLEEI